MRVDPPTPWYVVFIGGGGGFIRYASPSKGKPSSFCSWFNNEI